MAMTIEQIHFLLGADEPNYPLIGRLLSRDDITPLEALAQGQDEMMASKAAYAISLVPNADALAALRRLSASGSIEVRVAVANGLPRLASFDVAPIAERLLGDTDISVRKSALKASGAMKLTSLKPRLSQMADGDTVMGLRAIARSAAEATPDPKP